MKSQIPLEESVFLHYNENVSVHSGIHPAVMKEKRLMIFGKHINKYYLKYGWLLLLGLSSLVAVDYLQLVIPNLYQMIINGMNQGYVMVDGTRQTFNMDFLLNRICMPMVWVILSLVFGRFFWPSPLC